MIQISRGDVHIHGQTVAVLEVWRRASEESSGELIAIIPLEDSEEKVQVEV